MKYIMFEVNDCPAPVLFPDHVPHKTVSISLSAMAGVHERRLKSAESNPEDANVIATVLGIGRECEPPTR